MITLGIDVGSSSIKVSLFDADKGVVLSEKSAPDTEMPMLAVQSGWAEQNPDDWWQYIQQAIGKIKAEKSAELSAVNAIGISYQMHGLVVVDKNGKPLRPSIIWCDSRAVPYGEAAYKELGSEWALSNLLNSPGNFTAAKWKWVKENEPELFEQIAYVMLPGDYIAYMLTGEFMTTKSGLSEGIMWNFKEDRPAFKVLETMGLPESCIPPVVDSFGSQGKIKPEVAQLLGISSSCGIYYRGGDQPNNALALNVLNSSEAAVNAGTSGVIYAVTDKPLFDKQSRVNGFLHVNSTTESPKIGVLACVNGTGIMNSWVRKLVSTFHNSPVSYEQMNLLANQAEAGSKGLMVFPFGNGSERTLDNKDINALIKNLNFNVHTPAHLVRASQEGIAFALAYSFEIMRDMGIAVSIVRAGNANMFLSGIFRDSFATITNTTVSLHQTDGAAGAARAAAIGAGHLGFNEAFASLKTIELVKPKQELVEPLNLAYNNWKASLNGILSA